ncbi:hypothetical protein SO802_005342 [Lithocarpus litseifolius]|uniref:RNase H type-1 domain-containing protein n=1 Tax=Lithocarpus litseifolius TaxID=425828 RepID=A0AAW2DJF2_9ROSI
MHLPNDDVEDWVVADLIDHELHEWRIDVVMVLFHEEEANAICKIPLSQRGAESSNGSYGKQVWATLWKLKITNKIKVFGWRACHDIFPTRLNLTKRRIISKNNRASWEPPPKSAFKLNFDAVVFSEANRTGVRAIIHNYKGEVMAAMFARGSAVQSSEEGELLECTKAIEFTIDASFSRLVIEGDNVDVIKAISSQEANVSLLGNVVEDIKHLIRGLQWVSTSHIRRSGNKVAHVLAQHARIIVEDLYWIEDSPPPVIEQLY